MIWMLATALAAPPTAADLAWMTGTWLDKDGDRVVEETWTAPRGGTLMGINRSTEGNQTRFYESLRIEPRDGVLTYVARPKGAPQETPFALTEHGTNWVLFANPLHDFPKTLRYQRDGDTMRVSVRGDGGKGFDLNMTLEP